MTRYRAEALVTCNRAFDVHRPGVVDVDGVGRITWVGPAEQAPPAEGGEQMLAGLLMPGLINTHCHSAMTLFRGAAEDIALDRFLREVLWPREARLTDEDVYWGMALACSELLRFGVTTSCEMYFFEEAQLQAVLAAGFRSLITPGILEVPGIFTWKEMLERVVDFHDRHAGHHHLVEVGFGAHSAYTIPPEGLEAVAEAAQDRRALIHTHIAETREEGRPLEEEHGKTVPAFLADLGFLEGRVLAAHSVWLTEEDLRIYQEHDLGVAHCPQSNAKLASGIARLADMLELGLRVGLGTDGPASNNDLDLWEEMRLAPLLARLRGEDPTLVSAAQALTLATRGGAEALGRQDIGALEPGRWADMVLVRTDDSAFVPQVEEDDLVSHLVWSASSRLVSDVWVGGHQVVRQGRCLTVDQQQARSEVDRRARRLAVAG
ncbi:MAG: amidohydrolase [Actinomycetota bacterium]|nr:amidohydrolase [Actinomycetota bacterium]